MEIETKVKIRKDSEFFDEQGHHGIGRIVELNRGADRDFCYIVKFEDAYNDHYRDKDLMILSWKEKFATI